MKLWEKVMNETDPSLIAEAMEYSEKTDKESEALVPGRDPLRIKKLTKRLLPVAAALALVLIGTGVLLSRKPLQETGAAGGETKKAIYYETGLPESGEENAFEKAYRTVIPEGTYAGWQSLKVCDASFVGEKLGDITVEAGWKNASEEYVSEKESLRAQVFHVKGVDPAKAVCLKFTDKGDALTTDHYYVYVAPAMDEASLAALKALLWPQPAEIPAEGETVTGFSRAADE